MSLQDNARDLIKDFKGGSYVYGAGVLSRVGEIARRAGKRAAIVRETFSGSDAFLERMRSDLAAAGVEVAAVMPGAAPNAPREDLYRIADGLKRASPDLVVSFGGGSTIDAVKAADVLVRLGGEIDRYFGVGLVAIGMKAAGSPLSRHVAIQTAASSAAHLTKYSNITDARSGQKKLIVDDSIVPSDPVFDYRTTLTAPPKLTMDGALDGISHCLEVLYGAVNKPFYGKTADIARTGISLAVHGLPGAISNPENMPAREELCLATDLGGYAIMLGSTNGGHLTSFSLVDILSHGRACAIMNPYYTVLFASAIEAPLRLLGEIYMGAGLVGTGVKNLQGRDLGIAVAEGMFALAKRIGFPTRLGEVPGFTDGHIRRALAAAKDPQLEMKLKAMPVPMNAGMVDDYMAPLLEAARDGDLESVRTL